MYKYKKSSFACSYDLLWKVQIGYVIKIGRQLYQISIVFFFWLLNGFFFKCECECPDGSKDNMDSVGNCPCECKCPDCDEKSTLGPDGCQCDDESDCPLCEEDETIVYENCQCSCRKENECGISPACVQGRKGPNCDQPDCFPNDGNVDLLSWKSCCLLLLLPNASACQSVA